MFFFGFINFFTGITLYDPYLHQLYNVFYSIFPIFYFSIFDREYDSNVLINNPNYYIQGIKNNCFNTFTFIKHFFFAFLEGFLFIFFYNNNYIGYNLNNLYSFGTAIFSGIIIIVNLKVLLNSKIIDIFIIILIFLSIFSFYVGVILFSGEKFFSIYLGNYFSYNYLIIGDYSNIIKDKKYFLFVIFIIGSIVIIEQFLDQVMELLFAKYRSNNNKDYNSSNTILMLENRNDEKSEKNYSNGQKMGKEEDYELQIINSSEDFD